MKSVVYRFADGTKNEIPVTDELYEIITGLEKENGRVERKETRRHILLSYLTEKGIEPSAEDDYAYGDRFFGIKDKNVYEAIRRLDENRKDLLYKVFFERMRIKEIADEEGVSSAAKHKQLKAVMSRLGTKK